jgi:hypothetical protein
MRFKATIACLTLLSAALLIARFSHGSPTSSADTLQHPTLAILTGGCDGFADAGLLTIELYGLGTFHSSMCSEYVAAPGTGGLPMPSSGNLRNLTVALAKPCDSTSEGNFTVFLNGTATLLSCTVGTNTSCRDGIDRVQVHANDLIEVRYQTSQSGSCPNTPRVTIEKQ